MTWFERLFDEAECGGLDPSIFTADRGAPALVALDHCLVCPVFDLCESWVRPGPSGFTGVAGGKVWSEGFDVTQMVLEEVDAIESGETGPAWFDIRTAVNWPKVNDALRGVPDASKGMTTTDRMAAVVALVAAGLDSATISERLSIRVTVVKRLHANADKKLGADAAQARNIGRAVNAFG